MRTVRAPNLYAAAVLDRLRTTRSGRSHAIFAAACTLGELVTAGAFFYEHAEALLLDAGMATGKPEREVRGHVTRGLQRGIAGGSPHHVDTGWTAQARQTAAPSPTTVSHAPHDEVMALWHAAQRVEWDQEAAAYLREERRLPVHPIDLWGLARAIPADLTLPRWARVGRTSWHASGHRLALPTYDATGRMAGLRARYIGAGTPKRKTLAPSGFTTKGLVMACPLGVQLLCGSAPDWWTQREVVIAEGDMDFLVWVTRQPECSEVGPAVFGITSGCWTQEIADRVPTCARVVIRTHQDEAGERYAEQIHATLRDRCETFRPLREAIR